MIWENHRLQVGWATDGDGHPLAWLAGKPARPVQSGPLLVELDAGEMARNTAVVAQSGSGKSFFLARLVEELMLRTRADCVILDTNGDFRGVSHLVSEDAWEASVYDQHSGKGVLHTEGARDEVLTRWKDLAILIESNCPLEADSRIVAPHSMRRIEVAWQDVPCEFISEQMEGTSFSEVALCHKCLKLVVDQVTMLYPGARSRTLDGTSILSLAASFLGAGNIGDVESVFQKKVERTSSNGACFPAEDVGKFLRGLEAEGADQLRRLVDPAVSRRYFAVATDFLGSAFTIVAHSPRPDCQLNVLDIASVRERAVRLAIVSTAVDRVLRRARAAWEDAMDRPPERDIRVPTFLVVDEAHHMAPRNAGDGLEKRLVEQFREVATEGRKLGVFLILATQRPDRLDAIVAGECSNVAVMRLNNDRAITGTAETFGLDPAFELPLREARRFRTGRGVLFGPWAGERPKFFYTAGRRTTEGGRDLRRRYWTKRGMSEKSGAVTLDDGPEALVVDANRRSEDGDEICISAKTKRYHRRGCRYVPSECDWVSLSALPLGFQPCGVCQPPVRS